MPWCPKCKYEYVDGARRCAPCDVDLVDHLPEEPEPPFYPPEEPPVEMALLTAACDSLEADLYQSMLRSENIISVRKYRGPGQYLHVAMGRARLGSDIELYVHPERLEEARDILSAEAVPVEEDAPADAPPLPSQGKWEGAQKWQKWLVRIAIVLCAIFTLFMLLWNF